MKKPEKQLNILSGAKFKPLFRRIVLNCLH